MGGKATVRENTAAVMGSWVILSIDTQKIQRIESGPRLQTLNPVTYFLQTLQNFQIDQQLGTKGSNT